MAVADPARAFLGVAWSFPLRFEGGKVVAAYETDVLQAILIILGTSLGERVMRPDFGGFDRFVFEPISPTDPRRRTQRDQRALEDDSLALVSRVRKPIPPRCFGAHCLPAD